MAIFSPPESWFPLHLIAISASYCWRKWRNNQHPYLYGGVPRRGWCGRGKLRQGDGTTQGGNRLERTTRADKLHNRLTRAPLYCIYNEGVSEEDERYRGMKRKLPIGIRQSKEVSQMRSLAPAGRRQGPGSGRQAFDWHKTIFRCRPAEVP